MQKNNGHRWQICTINSATDLKKLSIPPRLLSITSRNYYYSYSLPLSRKVKLEGREEKSPAVMTKHDPSPGPPPNFHKTATSKTKDVTSPGYQAGHCGMRYTVSYSKAQPEAETVMNTWSLWYKQTPVSTCLCHKYLSLKCPKFKSPEILFSQAAHNDNKNTAKLCITETGRK